MTKFASPHFLNRDKVDLSADARRQAACRLMEQALSSVKWILAIIRYPNLAMPANRSKPEGHVSQRNRIPECAAGPGITADELTRRLWWQFTLLRFIDYRFRPGIQIPTTDVQAYYRQQVSEWEQKGTKPIPTLDESRDQIEEILTQQRIDQALDQWMNDTRKQVTIHYLDPGLRMRKVA